MKIYTTCKFCFCSLIENVVVKEVIFLLEIFVKRVNKKLNAYVIEPAMRYEYCYSTTRSWKRKLQPRYNFVIGLMVRVIQA